MKAMMLMAAAVTAAPAMAAVYTNSAAFLADVQPGFYFNNFTGLAAGPSGPLNYSGNGFSYTITASGPNNAGLYNDPGVVSTNNALDGILVTFTSGNVTAVGGNFWATDINVFPIPATVTITTSDGQSSSFTSAGPNSFRGFTSNVLITSIFIDAADTPANAWSTMDNLYVGQAIPAPGAMALLGLGGLAAARRRR